MTGRLAGKKAIITAAAQGIGRATAEAFLAEGAEVIATDINMDLLTDLADRPRTKIDQLDALDPTAIEAAAKRHGTVDILFNCAGFVHHGTILDAQDDEWDFAFELNVKAMYRMSRAFLPAMIENGGGAIINMSSVASSVKGIVDRCVYGTTKAAVIGLTKSIAADYVGQGIRCNAICPGTVDTPSLQGRIDAFDDPVQARAEFIARQPMGRLGNAEEIAALAIYLGSDDASYTTGQAYLIDGGITI
jgi:2-keto-3-deoxy-L-fuconate dehydrogenase